MVRDRDIYFLVRDEIETETFPGFYETETRPRRLETTSRDRLETKTSRPRLHPWCVCVCSGSDKEDVGIRREAHRLLQ